MRSYPVRGAVAGTRRVWFHTASCVSSSPFSFLGLLKHIMQAAYTLQSSRGYPLVNATVKAASAMES